MKDNSDEEAPASPRGKRVLGKLSKGKPDSGLERAPEGAFGKQVASPSDKEAGGLQQRKGSKPPARASHRRPPRYETGDDDKITLPEDALVAMRRSGGLRFTLRSVVIYRDGRVATEGTGYGKAKQVPVERLDDEEFAELYRALDTAWGQGSGVRDQGLGVRDRGPGSEADNFIASPSTFGRQNPDGYAYEIVARMGADTYSVEAFDGSIPEQLAPLIEFLSRQMRRSR